MTTTDIGRFAGLTRCTIATVTDTPGIDTEPVTGVITHAAVEQIIDELDTVERQHIEGSPSVHAFLTYRDTAGQPGHAAYLVAPSGLDAVTQQLQAMACC